MTQWTPEYVAETFDVSGKIAIVTGANSGIGLETARALAKSGAQVVLACRNEKKATAALEALRADSPAGSVEFMQLDLSSLASVEAFAAAFTAKFDRLDLLINNAGVMVPPKTVTDDGVELQFGTNHLGHFALTGRLLPLLLATPNARVVSVSSVAHKFGKINLDNLATEKGYSAWTFYGQSKLANLLFTAELQRRLEAAGADTMAVAAHPGWTATNLQANTATARMLNPLFAMKPPEGALPTLYGALSPDAEPDGYYGPGGLFEMRGPPTKAKKSKRARDPETAAALWARSVELTGVDFAAI